MLLVDLNFCTVQIHCCSLKTNIFDENRLQRHLKFQYLFSGTLNNQRHAFTGDTIWYLFPCLSYSSYTQLICIKSFITLCPEDLSQNRQLLIIDIAIKKAVDTSIIEPLVSNKSCFLLKIQKAKHTNIKTIYKDN